MLKPKSSLLGLLLSVAGLLTISNSCSQGGWTRISSDEVRRLLPRYALLTATLQNQSQPDSVRVAAYKHFFEQEGYTLRDWDSTMAWYAKNNMPLYYDIYRLSSDSLTREADRLQLRQDSLFRIEEQLTRKRNYNLDSVNLLSIGATYAQAGGLINQSFSIAPSPAYTSAELELSTRIQGLPKHLDKGSALNLYLQFSLSDSTIIYKTLKITKSGAYNIKLKTKSSTSVQRVYGCLQGIVPKGTKLLFLDSLRLKRYPAIDTPIESAPKDSIPPPTTADVAEALEM